MWVNDKLVNHVKMLSCKQWTYPLKQIWGIYVILLKIFIWIINKVKNKSIWKLLLLLIYIIYQIYLLFRTKSTFNSTGYYLLYHKLKGCLTDIAYFYMFWICSILFMFHNRILIFSSTIVNLGNKTNPIN